MSSAYTNYLATTTFRPYLQPTPGLGTSARTAGAIILGGPRAGAGSAGRVYNFLKGTGQIEKILYSNEFQNINQKVILEDIKVVKDKKKKIRKKVLIVDI